MNGEEPLLSVRDLVKTYRGKLLRRGITAVDGVSLEVGRGTVFGLLGPNGAGKTTLIKILLGLVRKTRGQASLFGRPAGWPASRRRVGYLPEAHRLPPHLTGRQVLLLFGTMCGGDRRTIRRRVPELLEQVDMTADADRKVREYSKGMQQRIGLAQALVHDPELIFLDEPTDGVDPMGRAAIREVIEDRKRGGATIFINSHLLMEVEMTCERVVIMDRGRILREGTTEELTPRTGSVQFELAEEREGLEELLAGIGAGLVRRDGGFELQVTDEEQDACVDRLRAAGVGIRSMTPRRINLEEAFIDMIGKERE